MALRCYPLQPGGLLTIEAVAIGMTSPMAVYEETANGIEVLLLLIFMVAGIFFLKQLLLFVFTTILLRVRAKCAVVAVLLRPRSLTFGLPRRADGDGRRHHGSGRRSTASTTRRRPASTYQHADHDPSNDDEVHELHREDLEQFRAFLRSLVMHAAVGTALGGVTTLVGEPQNLLIATTAGWDFREFFVRMLPVSAPVLAHRIRHVRSDWRSCVGSAMAQSSRKPSARF